MTRTHLRAILLAVAAMAGVHSVGAQEMQLSTPGGSTGFEGLSPMVSHQVLRSWVGRYHQPGVTYGGLLVDAARLPDPWQFANPWAPHQYGDGFSRVTRDPTTGRVDGLAVFRIRF